MNDELKRFFDAIDYDSDEFVGALVDRVIHKSVENSFSVYIECNNLIDTNELDRLYEKSCNGLKGSKLNLFVNVTIDGIDSIKNMIDKYFDSLSKDKPSLMFIKDYNISLVGDVYTIVIDNKLVDREVEEVEERLVDYLHYYGLSKYKFILRKSDEEIKSLQETLEESSVSVVVKKEESPIILGKHIDGDVKELCSIYGDIKKCITEVYVFGIDISERKTSRGFVYIMNLKISDKTNSYMAKFVRFDEEEFYSVAKRIKTGSWYRMVGEFAVDDFLKQMILSVKHIEAIKSKDEEVVDDAPLKRVELHTHTMMSMMDGVIDASRLLEFAAGLGHNALAVTDHNVLQSFPDLFNGLSKINKKRDADNQFKMIYGVEMNVVDTDANLVYNCVSGSLYDREYIVFDTETTGLNAGVDQLIEIGAVRIKDGEIIDRFDELIACSSKLPDIIVKLTSITDDMLVGKDCEENVVKRFLDYIGTSPLVAHNASFDISFMEAAMRKYELGEFNNTVVDTMALARVMFPTWRNHKLSTLVRNLKVEWDEDKHHRADYDSEGTGYCFYKLLSILKNEYPLIKDVGDLDSLVDIDNVIKFARAFHMSILAKNKEGLKNLFKIVSLANTKYLYKGKEPKIPREELIKYKDGLLFGSGCVNGEVFDKGFSLDDEELRNMMNFYDYIEVYPKNTLSHKIGVDQVFLNEAHYVGYTKRLINVAKSIKKTVVATGDVHNLREEDLLSRKIIVNQKMGGKIHPLNRSGIEVPNQCFLTTNEMLEAFDFLSKEEAFEIVVENTNKIAESIDNLQVIKDDLYTPLLDNSADITKEMVYKKAREIYGEVLPTNIEERIEAELSGIIGGGFDVIYLIAEKLVKKSNADGYFVGSRGSVGSSLVATFMGITEVNGLPAHYVCPNCKKSIFEIDGKVLGEDYSSGYDLPDLDCSCGTKMNKEGQDMPFATFLGFKAEKVPDIDLNFSGDNQADAHNYVKELFGEMNAYRAGTISTVAAKTAYGYVKGYLEDKAIMDMNSLEIERISLGCTGVKRTTGQHPGGIIVIPQNMDVYDFSAFQYPADEPDSSWYTTHFDFHAIHDNVLKLDILGHDDPTMLKYLGDTTGIDISKLTFDDEKILSLFNSTEALGVKSDEILCPTGTLGIPEFGTNFVINMLLEIKPKRFSDLVKISGLSHGTNVWQGNVRDLIVNEIATFDKVVGCRDDIMVFLINYGMEPSSAFKISEFVRKGKAKYDPDSWMEFANSMRSLNIPEWFIESCRKIEYMFPKAHACAYVMMAYRVAWFKVYKPLYYYSAFFSIRRSDFDVDAMLKGIDGIKRKIAEIKEKGYGATNKEIATADTLNVALEMLARGFTFTNININESMAKTFVINEDNKTLIMPFMALDGLGEAVANKIVEERETKQFTCVEDFMNRGKVNKTAIEKLRTLNVFDGLQESAQMSLF